MYKHRAKTGVQHSDTKSAMKKIILRPLVLLAVAVLGAAGTLASFQAAAAQPQTVNVRLDARRQLWTDAKFELAPGQTADFKATGIAGWVPGVDVGPDGLTAKPDCELVAPDAPMGSLLGRVGDGPAMFLGSSGRLTGPGHVALLYNDCPGNYFNNRGAFEVIFSVSAAPTTPDPDEEVAPTAEATIVEPVVVEEQKDGKAFDPWIPLVILGVMAAGAGAFYGRRHITKVKLLLPHADVPMFASSARLESSAWLSPVRLRTVQGERRPKKFLNVGGPGSDVDFGLPKVWARIHPVEDGGARLEALPNVGRILVDGKPIVMGQRLTSGSRVFMNTREFIYRADAEENSPPVNALNRRGDALSRPDPRASGM
jgi:hypothetical protein